MNKNSFVKWIWVVVVFWLLVGCKPPEDFSKASLPTVKKWAEKGNVEAQLEQKNRDAEALAQQESQIREKKAESERRRLQEYVERYNRKQQEANRAAGFRTSSGLSRGCIGISTAREWKEAGALDLKMETIGLW